MEREHKYVINGKTYVQRPLVLGQIPQLQRVLQDVDLPADIDSSDIISLMGDKLPEALAVVLTEEGTSPKDKDVAALGKEFQNCVDFFTAMEVIDHFFDLNRVASVSQRVINTIIGLRMEMTRVSGLSN